MLRQAVADGTPLGVEAKSYMDSGELVPDNVIIGVIVERMESGDALDGFLLDGFPRTIVQAEALDEALERAGRDITGVLLIDAPDDEIVRRISGRRVGPNSGRVYHVEFDPPQVDGKDDADGADLIQRDDDRPETIRKRLDVYHAQTAHADEAAWHGAAEGPERVAHAFGDLEFELAHLEFDDDLGRRGAAGGRRHLRRAGQHGVHGLALGRTEVAPGGATGIGGRSLPWPAAPRWWASTRRSAARPTASDTVTASFSSPWRVVVTLYTSMVAC